MPKPDIHPTWYPDAKVICNGEVVMTTGSTQPQLNVDVWSGTHPFYTGTQKILDTEGRVDRFGQKAKEVRCTMLYGQDNPVDGFILHVILHVIFHVILGGHRFTEEQQNCDKDVFKEQVKRKQ